jgi:hypothetical protein
MKSLPEPAGFDKGINTGKWAWHDAVIISRGPRIRLPARMTGRFRGPLFELSCQAHLPGLDPSDGNMIVWTPSSSKFTLKVVLRADCFVSVTVPSPKVR